MPVSDRSGADRGDTVRPGSVPRDVAVLARRLGQMMAARMSPEQMAVELIDSGSRLHADPYVSLVHEFHRVFGVGAADEADLAEQPRATIRMRAALIEEEASEAADAIRARDLPGTAKELCDLLYVAFGGGVRFGIPVLACFRAVHEANMSKLGADGRPLFRADGKVLKGPNYRPPDIGGVLAWQAQMRALLVEAARVPTRPGLLEELQAEGQRREQGQQDGGRTGG